MNKSAVRCPCNSFRIRISGPCSCSCSCSCSSPLPRFTILLTYLLTYLRTVRLGATGRPDVESVRYPAPVSFLSTYSCSILHTSHFVTVERSSFILISPSNFPPFTYPTAPLPSSLPHFQSEYTYINHRISSLLTVIVAIATGPLAPLR